MNFREMERLKVERDAFEAQQQSSRQGSSKRARLDHSRSRESRGGDHHRDRGPPPGMLSEDFIDSDLGYRGPHGDFGGDPYHEWGHVGYDGPHHGWDHDGYQDRYYGDDGYYGDYYGGGQLVSTNVMHEHLPDVIRIIYLSMTID